MVFFKLGIRVTLIFLFVIGLCEVGYTQGCLGTSGLGPTGGAIKISNGFACANIDALLGVGSGAVIDITAGDIVDGDLVEFIVDWNDGSATPILAANKVGPNNWQLLNLKHYFPTTGADVKCKYEPRIFIRINGTICGNFGQSPEFNRWNVDSENSGLLEISETATSQNVFPVCKGTSTTVTFTDRSTLNCVPPEAPPNNTAQRWRRFTYGSTNTITSATGVLISGAPQAFPFVGGLITANPSQTPLPPPNTLSITIPDDAQVGEEFHITMEYWNTCNPFPGVPVTQTAIIRIIDAADRPLILDREICFGDLAATSLNITNVQGGVTYRWYPTLVDAQNETNAMHTGNSFSPTAGEAPVDINDYFVKGSWGLNSCVSPIEEVILTRRPSLPQPPAITGPTTLCTFSTYIYSLPVDPLPESPGGLTEYFWSIPGTWTLNSGQGSKQISVTTSGTLGATNVSVVRRFVNPATSGSQCPSNPRSLPVTVVANPTVAPTTPVVLCQGTPGVLLDGNTNGFGGATPTSHLWTGNTGILDDPNIEFPEILSTAPPGGPYTLTYTFTNSIGCSASGNVSVTINTNPALATVGIDQALCGTLISNSMGGSDPTPGTGTWSFTSSVPVRPAPAISNVNDPNATITIVPGREGAYTMTWTVVNGVCTSSADIVVDLGSDPTDPLAGNNKVICGESTNLEGNTPIIGAGTWTIVSGPGGCLGNGCAITIATPADPTSSVQLTGPGFTYGAYTLRWTTKSGDCPPEPDDVIITFNQPATATVQSDFYSCVDETIFAPIPLTAAAGNSIGGGATLGQWQIVSGFGTFTSSNAAAGSLLPVANINDAYRPVADDFTAGSVQLKLVAIDPDGAGPTAPCGNVDSPTLTITFDRKPFNVSAGPANAICDGSIAQLTATGTLYGGQGTWTSAPVVALDNDNSPTAQTTSGLTATTTFTWSVKSKEGNVAIPLVGSCPIITDDVLVTVRPLPDALDPTPNDLCETNAFTSIAVGVDLTLYNDGVTGITNSTNRTVEWYASPTDRALGTGEITAPYDILNSIVLYTRVIDTFNNPPACEALGEVTFTVNPKPFVNVQDVALCEDLPVGSNRVDNIDLTTYDDGTTTLTSNRTITWHLSDAEAQSGSNAIVAPVSITTTTPYFARVVDDNTSCFNVAQLNLTISPRPLDQVILGSATPCRNGTELYRVNQISGAQYIWDVPPQFTTLGGGALNDFYVLLEFPGVASADIKVTIVLNGCPGNERTKTITVSPDPTPFTIVLPTETICAGGIYPFSITPDNTGSSTYNWQIFKQSDGSFGGGIVANGQTTGSVLINVLDEDIIVRVTESNASGCAGSPEEEPVVINNRPVIDNTNIQICSGDVTGITLVENGSSPVTATTFDIQVPTVLPGIAPVVGPTQGLALPPDAIALDSYKNQTNAPQLSLLYRVIPISPIGCKGTEKSVIIDIKAEPLMDTSPIPAVCSDNEINVTLKSAIGFLPADKFEIVSINYDPLLLTPLTPLPVVPTGLVNADFIKTHIWENITSINQEVIYIVRPFSSLTGCFGNPPAPIRVTIQPKPLVTPVTITEICSGDVLSIPLTSVNIPGATFIWTPVPVAGIIGTTGSTTSTITDQLFNTTLSTLSVMYNVKATNPSSSPLCVGPSEFVQIDVRPSPPVITPLDKITCSDDFGGSTSAQDLTLLHPQISTEPGVTFTWFTDANDSINSKIPIADLTAYTLSDEVPVYVRVRNPAASSGCAKVSTVTFDIRPTPELLLDPRETTDPRFNITCNNQNNGEVEVSAQFGTNHTFRVDGGSFIPALLFSNLSAGFHTFSTMNAEGCITDEQVELLQPDPIVPGLPNVVNVSCFNDPSPDGQISINAIGGTSMLGGDPLLFSLLQDPSNPYDPITETFSGLRASTYTIRIEDANGCTEFVQNIVVGQPNDLKLTIDITSNYNGFDVSCNGQTDGQISVLTTTGGTPLYTYTLLDENLNPTGNVSGEINGVFTNLSANILFSIKVTDNKGCEKISIPEYLFDPIPLNAGAIGFDTDICEGGDPTAFTELAEPFGGINLYTFEWLESSDNVNFVPATGVRTNSTYDPPILTSQMFYKRSVTSGTCLPEETDAFTVVVHTKPVATLEAPLQVCQGQTFILDFQFSNGQAPYFFDYFDGTNTTSLIGSDSRPVPISNYNATKTFTLTHLRDFYGCEPDAYPPSVTPIMINMDATFSVAPTLAQCSGGNFTFSYTRNPDVEYVWSFNDGSPDRIIAAFTGGPPIADTVQHIFRSVNVSGNTKYPVTLKARSTLIGINCENQSLPQNVTISPTLFINLVADKDEICSGETVTYINSTLAANANHRWFYRTQGGDPNEVIGERNFTSASTQAFVYTNTSPALVTYELVYQVNNGSCNDEIVLPVIVHRGITAGIDTISTTKYIGGNAFANFINTSVPQDGIDFRYEWQFDAGSVPTTFNGIAPPQILYTTIGEKTISLTVTNTVAEARGLTCGDDASMLIYILLPGIDAGFSYTPQATCFPSDIEITENRGTGDLFEWKLRKVNDSRPLLISNDVLPTFKVVSPGFYVIEFKTTNSITGQSRETDNSATPIEIFDVPFASFEARPPTLYVPDEKLIITNRSSEASQYDWDSGAGEISMLPEPTFTYSNAGKYTVTLVAGFNHGAKDFDGDGVIDGDLICYDTARQEITAKEGGLTRIPNAFTPNTNGPNGGISGGGSFNDVFLPITKGVEEFEMTIFDRWGSLIFQSTNKNVGWDGYDKNGVLLPAGVYVYKLTMRLSNDQRTTQVGDVTLIR